MSLVDKLLLQLEQLYDALDPILLPGLAYLAVRGYKHLRKVRFALIVLLLVCGGYVALFGLAATNWVQERYYRPIIPFAAVLAAMGYYCLARDVRKKAVLYTLMALVAAACLWDALQQPIRAHRKPQTEAGRWLRRQDPEYDGFVISRYSQPVYCARMKLFDPAGTESLFHDMRRRGHRFRYIILDGDERGNWPRAVALQKDWVLVYRDLERDLRIYASSGFEGRAAEGSDG